MPARLLDQDIDEGPDFILIDGVQGVRRRLASGAKMPDPARHLASGTLYAAGELALEDDLLQGL
jgi:hypothetical protein